MLSFIAIFVVWYRVIFRHLIAAAMCTAIGLAVWLTGAVEWALLIYVALGLATVLYLQAFVTIAYDIRKAGNVREK